MTIAKAGWSKLNVKRYLFEHRRMPAHVFERQLAQNGFLGYPTGKKIALPTNWKSLLAST